MVQARPVKVMMAAVKGDSGRRVRQSRRPRSRSRRRRSSRSDSRSDRSTCDKRRHKRFLLPGVELSLCSSWHCRYCVTAMRILAYADWSIAPPNLRRIQQKVLCAVARGWACAIADQAPFDQMLSIDELAAAIGTSVPNHALQHALHDVGEALEWLLEPLEAYTSQWLASVTLQCRDCQGVSNTILKQLTPEVVGAASEATQPRAPTPLACCHSPWAG